jgi:pyruvate formate lyase activating enzyme
VLPYHTMGQHKFEALGIPYQLEGVKSPTADRVENAKSILNGII